MISSKNRIVRSPIDIVLYRHHLPGSPSMNIKNSLQLFFMVVPWLIQSTFVSLSPQISSKASWGRQIVILQCEDVPDAIKAVLVAKENIQYSTVSCL